MACRSVSAARYVRKRLLSLVDEQDGVARVSQDKLRRQQPLQSLTVQPFRVQ
jgi:hypothetical protein